MGHPIKKINEIAYSWASRIEQIQSDGFSHLLKTPDGCLIVDPLLPEDGNLSAILEVGTPEAIVVLNQHHIRDAAIFKEKTSAPIFLLDKTAEKVDIQPDRIFCHGEELPGGFKAHSMGHPTDCETVLIGYHTLIVADALVNTAETGGLSMIPKMYAPNLNTAGLKQAVQDLLIYQFETILLGHGNPITDQALEQVCQLLE